MSDATVMAAALTFFVTPIVIFLATLHSYNYLSTPIFVGLVALVVLSVCGASVAYGATYTYKNGLVVKASSFKIAAHLCYNTLTNGKYPGEERGLEIIDICANPKGVK